MTAPLLGTGGLLLAVVLLLLPQTGGWPLGWAVVAWMGVHALVVWLVPARTLLGDLAAVAAVVTATAAIGTASLIVSGGLYAWAVLLGLPVLYATSQMRRGVGFAGTLLGCVTAVLVLVVNGGSSGVWRVVDAVLICSCLSILAGLVVHTVEHVERMVEELERLAAVDVLTGLVTRRVLDDALAASLSSAHSSTGTALVLVDLDRFKSVNDRLGHPVGDAALQHVGALLSAAVRSTDAVVSRLGGDELAVLLPGCAAETARARAEDLVVAVRSTPLRLDDGSLLALTVSVGVAHVPAHAADVRSLYAAADSALYEAKRSGRDRSAVAGSAVLS